MNDDLLTPGTATPSSSTSRTLGGTRPFLLAGILLICLYGIHFYYCQRSALPYLEYVFTNSDMNANLRWAATIRNQGWLNPTPYHPYTTWMAAIAPYSQWLRWWGGEQIFQQSPLYAYLLAVLPSVLMARIVQALLSAGTCILIALSTFRMAGRSAGWIAFFLAGLYAPFYAYSWVLLRDGLSWFLMAALLCALIELRRSDWSARSARALAWSVGLLLGLGYLARETFLLIIPLTCIVLGICSWKRRNWTVLGRVLIGIVLGVSPLVVRNYCVGAPLFSSSTRFVEAFIEGNSPTSHPYIFVIPAEIGPILYGTGGKAIPVIKATITSHDGFSHWLRLQALRFLSLLDPYESPDNLSIYFMATVSPVVRFGICYWMIVVPALAGLSLGIYRRELGHFWLWLFLAVILASFVVSTPVSRYRQTLAIVFIPWAAYFLSYLGALIRVRETRSVTFSLAALALGWILVLGPFARQPRAHYERPAEYVMTAEIYRHLGMEKQFLQTEAEIQEKFPRSQP